MGRHTKRLFKTAVKMKFRKAGFTGKKINFKFLSYIIVNNILCSIYPVKDFFFC